MEREFEKIKKWNALMGNETPETFKIPSPEVGELAYDLMTEEAGELRDAKTKEDALDAVGDQLFVLFGNAAKYGLGYKEIFKYFKNICSSNDSKFANTLEEAEASIPKEAERLGISESEVGYMELDGRFVIFNKVTRKILKSVNYKPPTEY